ncbi:MAG: hypothetical protein K2X93_00705 [Candidatus Obscuribacterales bacterium]|nr:hypothetical protein [Candidatus Obscuribacterales bacterium]
MSADILRAKSKIHWKLHRILLSAILSATPSNSAFATTSGDSEASRTYDVSRLDSTPDFLQSDPSANLPAGGLTACGPVAASNALIWLARNGYPNLTEDYKSIAGQARLTEALSKQMKITITQGTSVTHLTNGLSDFLHSKGYKFKSIKYQGWEEHPTEFSTGVAKPSIEFIKRAFDSKSCILMMIGWYKHSKDSDHYRAFAQHWVTVVGYGKDKEGKLDPDMLIIHDSAPRSGATLSHDYVKVLPIEHGSFLKNRGRKTISAKGWYRLAGGLRVEESADCGIIDGIVVMSL